MDSLIVLLVAVALLSVGWGGTYVFGWAAFRAQRNGNTWPMSLFAIFTYVLQVGYAIWGIASQDARHPSDAAMGGAILGFCVIWWIRRHWRGKPREFAV